MRSLGGLVLLTGIGVGLFVYLPTPVDRTATLDHARRVLHSSTPPKVLTYAAPAANLEERTFSPGVSLASFTPKSAANGQVSIASHDPTSQSDPRADAAAGWKSVVNTSGAPTQTANLRPSNPDTRYELVIELQKQLKRVGCYYGRIDGSWGAGTKDAMQSFTARVNATLPVDEPDYLLLTLLQSQNNRTCGECPPGLALSADGRCLPQPAVAQSRPAPATQNSTSETLPWKTTVAGAAGPAKTQRLFTPVATSVVSSEPLPGRMAIGGPKTLPPVDSLNTSPYSAYTAPAAGGNPAGATVALQSANPDAAAAQPSKPSQARPSRSSRRDGPGTPRYNLMLSLGGVY